MAPLQLGHPGATFSKSSQAGFKPYVFIAKDISTALEAYLGTRTRWAQNTVE